MHQASKASNTNAMQKLSSEVDLQICWNNEWTASKENAFFE